MRLDLSLPPTLLLLLCLPGPLPGAAIPAFPGAEGFGSGTPGGRGGKVMLVRNLNDSGRGSLREACEAKGPRIVVFRVSGVIDLQTPIRVREPFLTIAGQSAPGGGVCLRGRGIDVDSHDVVIRHLRVRPGDIRGAETDGLAVGGESYNVVVDHCSVGWAVDENLSPSGAIRDVTVSWCIISEGLNDSVHHKGPHGYGSLVRAVGGVSLHHNLWAHNSGRNPRLGDNYARPPAPVLDVRNNVMYNYAGLSVVGDFLSVNYIGNFLRPGPDSRPKPQFSPTAKTDARFYLEGNVVDGEPERKPEAWFSRVESDGRRIITIVPEPIAAAKVRTTTAAAAFEEVLAGAGATRPARDAVDRRVVSDCRSRTGAIIDSQWEVGGWPEYRAARPPRDSDRDGMPDAWETARRLNPRDAKDASADRDGDGYTNIEEYLNDPSVR